MTEHLAFQEFKPVEVTHDDKCIWCGTSQRKNRSHIISQKLVRGNHPTNVLQRSVCQSCNSHFGKLEQWMLRYTPLCWLRFHFYAKANAQSHTNYIPSYFYDIRSQGWLVFSLEGHRQTRTITDQVILKNGELAFISERDPKRVKARARKIAEDICNDDFITDTKTELPEDFSPRVIVDNDRVIVIANEPNEASTLIERIRSSRLKAVSTGRRTKPENDGRNFQHFQWSKSNWIKFCAKIAFEYLCLFEGASSCSNPAFDQVKTYAMSGISKKGRALVFSEHGPVRDSDTPLPVFVDLSKGQNAPEVLNTPLIRFGPGMHSVSVHEINGWVCASVSVAGFPPSFLIMGGPGVHIRDFYVSGYDDEEDEFHYLKLAYDPALPVIPFSLTDGASWEHIAQTYGLKRVRQE